MTIYFSKLFFNRLIYYAELGLKLKILKRRGLLRVTNGGSRALKGLPQVPNMRILRYIFRSLSKLAGATGRRQRARAKFRLEGRFLNPHVPDL